MIAEISANTPSQERSEIVSCNRAVVIAPPKVAGDKGRKVAASRSAPPSSSQFMRKTRPSVKVDGVEVIGFPDGRAIERGSSQVYI